MKGHPAYQSISHVHSWPSLGVTFESVISLWFLLLLFLPGWMDGIETDEGTRHEFRRGNVHFINNTQYFVENDSIIRLIRIHSFSATFTIVMEFRNDMATGEHLYTNKAPWDKNSHCKIKRSHGRLIYIIRVTIPEKTTFTFEQSPDFYCHSPNV